MNKIEINSNMENINFTKKYKLESKNNKYIVCFQSIYKNNQQILKIIITHFLNNKNIDFYIEKTLEEIHKEYQYLTKYNLVKELIIYFSQLTKSDKIAINKVNNIIYNLTFIDNENLINFTLKRKIDLKEDNLKEIEDEMINLYKEIENNKKIQDELFQRIKTLESKLGYNNINYLTPTKSIHETGQISQNPYNKITNSEINDENKISNVISDDNPNKSIEISSNYEIPKDSNNPNNIFNNNCINNCINNSINNNDSNIYLFKENNNDIRFIENNPYDINEKKYILKENNEECEIFTAFHLESNYPIIVWTTKREDKIINIINLKTEEKFKTLEKHNNKIDYLCYFHNDNANKDENKEFIISLSKNDENNLIIWSILIEEKLNLEIKKIISKSSIQKQINCFSLFSNKKYNNENFIFIYDDNSREINYYKLDNQFNIIPQNENSDIIDNKENTNCLDTYFNKNNNKLYLVNFNSNNVYTIKEPLDRNREKTEFKKDGVIEHLYGFITERNNIIELFELNSEGVYIWNIYYNSEPDNIIKLNLSPIDMCLWNDDYLWLSSNKGFSLIEISKKENSIIKDIKNHYGSKIRKIKTPLEDASIVGIDEHKKLCLWYNGKNKNN